MPDIDLSSRRWLRLFDLVKLLQEETGKPVVDWLHLITLGIHDKKLTLRPDWHWKIVNSMRSRKNGVLTVLLKPSSLDHERPDNAYNHLDWDCEDWNFGKSLLNIHYTNQPASILPPKGLQSAIEREGIKIYRDDFRDLCEVSGYPLPRFWFTEEERQQATKRKMTAETQPENASSISTDTSSHAKGLNKIKQEVVEQRYKSAANKICEEIKKADYAGHEWHQTDYVELWTRANPGLLDGPSQQEKLRKEVNSTLSKSPYNLDHKKIRRKQKK